MLLRPIVDYMREKILPGSISPKNLIFDTPNLKMSIYSAHDDEIVLILHTLDPTNQEVKFVPFASTLFFELSQIETNECKDSKDLNCFMVTILYNGLPLQLPGCRGMECTF